MAKYFTDLNNEVVTADAMTDSTRAVSQAGAAYNVALVALLKNLKSLHGDADLSVEAERAERTISILSFEIRRLRDRPHISSR
jgi:hypothetical protein